MRSHFIATRMTIIKKTIASSGGKIGVEIGALIHCGWECKMEQSIWKTV